MGYKVKSKLNKMDMLHYLSSNIVFVFFFFDFFLWFYSAFGNLKPYAFKGFHVTWFSLIKHFFCPCLCDRTLLLLVSPIA
jgi:hypothetical protein